MMDWMIVVLHINAFLPLTEAVQAVVCMMGDFQILLIINESIKYIKENCICTHEVGNIMIEFKEEIQFNY